jgi:hypothetical protein
LGVHSRFGGQEASRQPAEQEKQSKRIPNDFAFCWKRYNDSDTQMTSFNVGQAFLPGTGIFLLQPSA